MTDDELRASLGNREPKPASPSHTRPIGESVGCSDKDALVMARAKNLIDADGWLRCWNCGNATDWHVSLHCTPCRVESIRQAPERRRREYEQQKLERQRQQEQSRPVQRVANRSFRDDY